MISLEESRPVAYNTRVSISFVYLAITNEKFAFISLFNSKQQVYNEFYKATQETPNNSFSVWLFKLFSCQNL